MGLQVESTCELTPTRSNVPRVAELGKTLLMVGALLVFVGGSLWLGDKLGLGRLPGDLVFRVRNVTVAFPLATSLVLSLVLTLALNLVFRGR